jgi:hypothetical protein
VLAHGPLADVHEQIRHDCDNPPCVNPAHLRAGSAKDNTADALARGRRRGRVLDEIDRDFIPRFVERLQRARADAGRRRTRAQAFHIVAEIFDISPDHAGGIYDRARREAAIK